MKTVTVFGAGKVAPKAIEYLAKSGYNVNFTDFNQTQIDATFEAIESSVHKNISAVIGTLDETVDKLTKKSDAVISLLPAIFHPIIARKAYENGSHFLSTSYLSPEMLALDFHAKTKKLLFLNEVGLDPGIDHMSAMELIDRLKEQGHTITGFESDCGGIPSDPNVNPLHYLSSWRVAGPLEAIQGPAEFLRDGEVINVAKGDLAKHVKFWEFDEINSNVESYPNRNSLIYPELFGLKPAKLDKFMRGTLRYNGWVSLMQSFEKAGLFSKENVSNKTITAYMKEFLNVNSANKSNLIQSLNLSDANFKVFEWLGLFQDQKINESPFETLVNIMDSKVQYTSESPSDLVIMKHFVYHKDAKGTKYKTTATLVYEGLSHIETAMSLTVGLPVAMATKLLLDDKLEGMCGVKIPIDKKIYVPILEELKGNKVYFEEKREKINK